MANKLYRIFAGVVTLSVLLAAPLWAQYRKPAPRTQPRGIAVVERFADGKMRLVPVCIFFENKYQDAAFYQLRTVPLALQTETLYEVQRSGEPVGQFNVQTAYRQGSFWYGLGKWKDYNAAQKRADDQRRQKQELSAADKSGVFRARGIDGGRDSSSDKRSKRDKNDKKSGDDTSKSGDNKPSSSDDSDRPVLHRKSDSSEDKTAEKTPPPDDDDPDRPRLKRTDDKPAVASADVKNKAKPTEEASAADEDDGRPRLRHNQGKETSGADLKGGSVVSKANVEPTAVFAAISDQQVTSSHGFALMWTEGEQRHMVDTTQALAAAELRKALPSSLARMVPKQIEFTEVDGRVYDLEMRSSPTVVFTAAYRAALPVAGSQPTLDKAPAGATYRVTVVARFSSEGKAVKLYSEVSDPNDLDNAPELRFVDAVDVDGDGRGELLFQKRGAHGVGWMVRRVTPYETVALFDGMLHSVMPVEH